MPVKDLQKLKQLQTQLHKTEGDAEALKIEVTAIQREYNQKLENARRLRKEISFLQQNETLDVSEHAIVRYFERVLGFDISDIKKIILSEQVVKLVDTLGGNGEYPSGNFSVKMKNYTVVTVITPS